MPVKLTVICKPASIWKTWKSSKWFVQHKEGDHLSRFWNAVYLQSANLFSVHSNLVYFRKEMWDNNSPFWVILINIISSSTMTLINLSLQRFSFSCDGYRILLIKGEKWRTKQLCYLVLYCLVAMFYYAQNLVVNKKKHNTHSAIYLLFSNELFSSLIV